MNLYVFSIGGSGIRVLHSLIMLLASGMKIKAEIITPVIIDTDEHNGNLETTKELMKIYSRIYNKISVLNGQESVFEKTKTTKTSVFSTKINEPVYITIDGQQYANLRALIKEADPTIDKDLKSEIETLFSNDNLDMPLTYGFIGNPNIGCVVLNYLFNDSQNFTKLVDEIIKTKTDKIFIISSIFGGTGAAGFPLLLNIFSDKKAPNTLGALSISPYYTLDDTPINTGNSILDGSSEGVKKYVIDPKQFNAKTFAAQLYYANYIKNSVDALYYVGDNTLKSSYPNCLGGSEQKNPAHVIELMGALSIIHFTNEIERNGNEADTKYIDFILNAQDETEMNSGYFGDLDLKQSLVRMWMFKRFYEIYLPEYLKKKPIPTGLANIGFNENCYEDGQNGLSAAIKAFLGNYESWVKDLNLDTIHSRKFKFVDTPQKPEDEFIHQYFEGYLIRQKGFFQKSEVKSDFLNSLDIISLKQPKVTGGDMYAKVVRYASQVIDHIINTKLQ
jgi:hypothetical protein